MTHAIRNILPIAYGHTHRTRVRTVDFTLALPWVEALIERSTHGVWPPVQATVSTLMADSLQLLWEALDHDETSTRDLD